MANLPGDLPIENAVAEQPGGVYVHLQVVIDAAANPDQDGRREFTIASDYPSSAYIRPPQPHERLARIRPRFHSHDETMAAHRTAEADLALPITGRCAPAAPPAA
jgi:hypothetical protein